MRLPTIDFFSIPEGYKYECNHPQSLEKRVQQVLKDNSGEVFNGDHYYKFESQDQESFCFV